MKAPVRSVVLPAFLCLLASQVASQAQAPLPMKPAAGALANPNWRMAPVSLATRWAKEVSPENALVEYPRPQMMRANWQNLNGLWGYGLTDGAAPVTPAAMDGQILVPYAYESALSGVGKASIPNRKIWYRRTFSVPASWKAQNVLLHFGAVNYDSTVILNGKTLGSHRGGFDAFDFDITAALKTGANELVVAASNPITADQPNAQVIGKQRVQPGGIFYTGATGIWQTVWLEPVPTAHIDSLKITPDVDAAQLRVTVNASGAAPVVVTVRDGGKVVATQSGTANAELKIALPNAKLWSPDAPFLYDLTVNLGTGTTADSVKSYAAMRKISLGKDEQGRNRIFLNNKFLFQVGALDQGYWPDGIFTAPTDDALKFDVVEAKKLGFNLLRKHAKVEPARWYYWADKLGVLVWQDMPQSFGEMNDSAKTQWDAEWREILTENHNSPSIVVWTTFNEGWGQHDTERIVDWTQKFDPSRLVNTASGWVDKPVGDIRDTHAYPGPWTEVPTATRATVNGEFGGITADLGHRWQNNVDVMGYGSTLKSGWLATKRFQDLMKTAYRLRDERGMSASVYTQITDVEQEINGLITYDRALVKLDPKIVAAANKGEFLPLPPNPNPDFVETSQDEAQQWRYTTEKPADNWTASDFRDANWKTGPAPFGHDIDGVRTQWTSSDIWIRRAFSVTAPIPAQLNVLIRHDEDAEVYINGVLAATVTGYTNDYKAVPMSAAARAALKPGANIFAVHVHQTAGGQGIDVGLGAPK